MRRGAEARRGARGPAAGERDGRFAFAGRLSASRPRLGWLTSLSLSLWASPRPLTCTPGRGLARSGWTEPPGARSGMGLASDGMNGRGGGGAGATCHPEPPNPPWDHQVMLCSSRGPRSEPETVPQRPALAPAAILEAATVCLHGLGNDRCPKKNEIKQETFLFLHHTPLYCRLLSWAVTRKARAATDRWLRGRGRGRRRASSLLPGF